MKVENAWYRVSVKAVIYNDKGDILLCRESNGVWDLPGGGLDHGESDRDCLKRELYEEMGCRIKTISSTPECFVTACKPLSKTRPWVANICYRVELENLNFRVSGECSEIRFFSLDEMKNIDTIENIKEFVKVMSKSLQNKLDK